VFIGAFAQIGSSPVARLLAMMLCRELYHGGEGSGLDCVSFNLFRILFVNMQVLFVIYVYFWTLL
jgi:hypothetical protein